MKKKKLLMTLAIVAIVSLVVACASPIPLAPAPSTSPSPAPPPSPPSTPSPPQPPEDEGPWFPPAPPLLIIYPIFNPPPGEFSPLSGRPDTVVHLFGHNFDGPNTQVKFGDVIANISSFTATEIVVKVPSEISSGGVHISITTDYGTAVSKNVFNIFIE